MNVPEIQIHEAKKKFDRQDCMFVDVRDPGSYRAAHIPGAVHLHDGNVQEFIAGVDKDGEVIVYPPSQKATGVNPWMNARWVPSVALAKEGTLRRVPPDEECGEVPRPPGLRSRSYFGGVG
jgi:hypothetical protein